MEKVKKGDIVARKSHNLDILFTVERIIKSTSGLKIAFLKGITIRIIADAYIDDLIVLDSVEAENCVRSLDIQIENRINNFLQQNKDRIKLKERNLYNNESGLILHLDGDKLYSEKSARYYKKMGLNAIVKNVPENKQYLLVKEYIEKYKPDVLVLTRTRWNDKNRN